MDTSEYDPQQGNVDARLSDEDVRSIVWLVAEMALVPGPIRRKRKALLDGLSELVLADSWLWAHSYIDRGELRPVNLQFQQCGRPGMRGRAAYALRVFGAFGVPPENAPLKELTFQGQHFTRSIVELVGRDVWLNKKSRAYVYILGVDDFVYSIVPTHQEADRTYFSGVGLGRRVRQPFFTPRERKIIHIVVGSVRWLHSDGVTADNADAVETLPVYLRCILPLLIEGRTNREIADAHNLSVDTVKKYASSLYDLLGVTNRAELIAKFSIGDGGYVP
jgi:hypothetical protein